jgi:hypothetical protein
MCSNQIPSVLLRGIELKCQPSWNVSSFSDFLLSLPKNKSLVFVMLFYICLSVFALTFYFTSIRTTYDVCCFVPLVSVRHM